MFQEAEKKQRAEEDRIRKAALAEEAAGKEAEAAKQKTTGGIRLGMGRSKEPAKEQEPTSPKGGKKKEEPKEKDATGGRKKEPGSPRGGKKSGGVKKSGTVAT